MMENENNGSREGKIVEIMKMHGLVLQRKEDIYRLRTQKQKILQVANETKLKTDFAVTAIKECQACLLQGE